MYKVRRAHLNGRVTLKLNEHFCLSDLWAVASSCTRCQFRKRRRFRLRMFALTTVGASGRPPPSSSHSSIVGGRQRSHANWRSVSGSKRTYQACGTQSLICKVVLSLATPPPPPRLPHSPRNSTSLLVPRVQKSGRPCFSWTGAADGLTRLTSKFGQHHLSFWPHLRQASVRLHSGNILLGLTGISPSWSSATCSLNTTNSLE